MLAHLKRAEGQLKMRSNQKVQKRNPPKNLIFYPNPTGRVLILKFRSIRLIPASPYGHILPYSQVVYADICHCLMIEYLKCEGLEFDEHQIPKIFTTSSLGVKAIAIFDDINTNFVIITMFTIIMLTS